ncbi:MAG TPA: AraC family transcriptional regulator [Pyrinomonadaceae bacterium]|nr:AraC family transcriptional regulator [Pyrinomonadaceae bacterium]
MNSSKRAAPVSLGSPRFRTNEHGSFLLTEAYFPAGHCLGRHFHDRTVVGITLSGTWDSILGQTRLANAPGMLHVEPAGDSHVNRFGSDGAHVLLIQPNHNEEALLSFKTILHIGHQVRVGWPGMQFGRRLLDELNEGDELTSLAITNLVIDLLILASRNQRVRQGPAPLWLKRSVDYLHARFLDRPSLCELAREAGVSPEHFAREFRRIFSTTVSEYLRRLRLEWASERLRLDNDSIAAIALAAGFADQSHFTRQFHRQFGVTPAGFRREVRVHRIAGVEPIA